MLKYGDVQPGDLVTYESLRGGKMTRRFGVVTAKERRPGDRDSFWAVWGGTIGEAVAGHRKGDRQATMSYGESTLEVLALAGEDWEQLDDRPDREPTAWDLMC